MIGKSFGDYVIEEEIGKGGMGKVYKAHQISLNRDVAIKILSHELSCDEEFVERFDIEAKSVASLIHQNIIQMYSKGVTGDGIHHFAMEYVDGEDLSDKIKSGVKFSEEEAIDIIIQVCQGLECAWRRNIIHRDIKPSNLVITKNGVVKVADFGLAKSLEATKKLTRTDVYMGTVNYTSPEQGEGKPLDHRTDIYSLGIVLYQLLTNKVPFEGEAPSSVIYKHVHESPVPPRKINSSLSSQIGAVVLKAIAKKPEARYQNMIEFREALETVKQILSDKRVESKKTISTVITSTVNDILRDRRRIAVIAPLLILMIVGGTIIYMLRKDAIEELAEVLVDGLANNLKESPLNVIIGKMTMKDTDYSSEYAYKILKYVGAKLKGPKYGSYFKEVKRTSITRGWLELTKENSPDKKKRLLDVVLEGHYLINKDKISTYLQLIDKNNKKISKFESSIKRSAIDDVSLVPDNINRITQIEKEIASVPLIKNDFRIDLSIDKGNGGIYTEGDNIKALFQTEVDCYIRVLYIDAYGNRILMYPTESDPKTILKKGEIYELHKKKKYEIIPPFGAEMIMTFASTNAFDDLGEVNIGGGYRGFGSNIKTSEIVTKLRGLQIRSENKDKMPKRSEVRVFLTTIKG